MAGVRLRRIDAGVRLHRIHRIAHDPIFFGPIGAYPEFRYDSPGGSYKVLYAARSLETARALKLYPLVDAGVAVHGLSFTDLHGDAYKKTWAVSAEINATTMADGILYTSRFENQRYVALFDRTSDAIVKTVIRKMSLTPAQAIKLAEHFSKQYIEPCYAIGRAA